MEPVIETTEEKVVKPKKTRSQKARNPQRKVSPEKYRAKQKKSFPEEELIRVNGTPYVDANPYGANKYIKDPRQDKFWELYMKGWTLNDPNARQSAVDAGYSETTAINITNYQWFKDRHAKLKRKDFLTKGERNLERFLDMDFTKLDKLTGEIGIDIDKAKLVADITKLVVTTLGKDEGYSSKTTLDQKVSGEVQIRAVSYADAVIEAPIEAKVIDITGEETNA